MTALDPIAKLYAELEKSDASRRTQLRPDPMTFTTNEIVNAVRILRENNVSPINGSFHACLHAAVVREVRMLQKRASYLGGRKSRRACIRLRRYAWLWLD